MAAFGNIATDDKTPANIRFAAMLAEVITINFRSLSASIRARSLFSFSCYLYQQFFMAAAVLGWTTFKFQYSSKP
jgi:hypothetical protein